MTLFAKTGTDLTNRSAFASPTKWQDPGQHRCWFKVPSPACMLPIFAKAPCCLELFGCCCRKLSQHGAGEVVILRHYWRDAFFCVCVDSGSFCHDWASHCSVLFWSLMRCLFFRLPTLHLSRHLTHVIRRALWAGLGEQIRAEIPRAFGGDGGRTLVATCLWTPPNIIVSRVPVGQKNLKRLVSAD